MMPGAYTWVAFVIVCLLILTLPFVPAFREWRRPTDVSSLAISANYTSDIDHFARRLRADAAARLGEGPATGYEDFDFVPEPALAMPWAKAGKRLISRSPIDEPQGIQCKQPLYVNGDLHAGPESAFTAVYARDDLYLGAESEVHDWAHAGGTLSLGDHSVALRRVSAGTAIVLGEEAWFERLHAPTVYFGGRREQTTAPVADAGLVPASYADLPDAVQQTPGLFRVRGNCALPAGHLYTGSLVVTGFLVIGEGTVVAGDIKAREGVSIGSGASVRGAVTCEKRVYVFDEARAWGPVVSESDILLGGDAVIGLPAALTTVTARNIIIERGVQVHGTVWAHEIGMVKQS
jgi:cytoskeletal protein CcmA (bactofilin family)